MDLSRLSPYVDETAKGEGPVRVVVETPSGARAKLKLDPESGAITLSRPLPLGLHYPFDWGFVPGTLAPDGDPLDAMILWEGQTQPGVVVACRAIGLLAVTQRRKHGQGRERNDRLFVVPVSLARAEIRDVRELPERMREELARFFAQVVAFQGKDIAVEGYRGPSDANRLIAASCAKVSPSPTRGAARSSPSRPRRGPRARSRPSPSS